MITAGAWVATSSRSISARPPMLDSCGPARMSGRCAPAMAASTASAIASASAGAGAAILRVSGQTMALLSTRSSSRSDGRLKCTGPGRPEVAIRIALSRSWPRVAADVATQDTLVTGAAISACRISWNPPRPSSQVAACPDSSTIGDSAPSAVKRAPTALAWPGPPVTRAMPASPVSRPHASAMWTAAASWRTCTRSSLASSAASKIDMM